MKNTFIAVIVVLLIIIGAGVYFLFRPDFQVPAAQNQQEATTTTSTATTTEESGMSVIGTSVQNRDITAYHYGTGDTEILFIAGIHGGYGWNTALLAYDFMDYLSQHPEAIPANERITIVPVLNPDGLYKVIGKEGRFVAADVPTSQAATVPGRFNADNVDLNRNFDCDWQATGTWQNTDVSGGTQAFSEPETQAIKTYVETHSLAAVVTWYSAAGGVFSSNCHNGVSPETAAITKVYANASEYKAYEDFNFYDITGDMVNWLAKQNIPAISVLLTNHTDVEWDKNLAGIQALLAHYAK